MIPNLLDLYKSKYPFSDFHDRLLEKVRFYPDDHILRTSFLGGRVWSGRHYADQAISTAVGDIRVDLPIWFGSFHAPVRIMVFGSEPRDTDQRLNIERNGCHVYASPFAVEAWKGGKYHNAFQELAGRDDTFAYFSDVVKGYEVVSKRDKAANDRVARKSFPAKALDSLRFLQKEIDLVKPNLIIGLGNMSHDFMWRNFSSSYRVEKAMHPAAHYSNGSNKAKEKIGTLLQEFATTDR